MNELLPAVFVEFNRRITDQVFLMIQRDPDLMRMYLEQVHVRGHGIVNREIGREVRAQYDLVNEDGPDDREKSPASVLIRDHLRFKRKPPAEDGAGARRRWIVDTRYPGRPSIRPRIPAICLTLHSEDGRSELEIRSIPLSWDTCELDLIVWHDGKVLFRETHARYEQAFWRALEALDVTSLARLPHLHPESEQSAGS